MKQLIHLLILIFLSFSACAHQTDSYITAEVPEIINYTTEVVVPNLDIPWGMVFLPDNSMLITEKSGELIHFKNGKKTSIEGLPEIYVRGQGGLMDIELHPDYNENGWIYFSTI